LLSSELWALGLGEIRLDSALNEPLRAEIELLSATPEELSGLRIAMASAETFDRYGLDRPTFLQSLQFQIRESGRAEGNVVEIRSVAPITEPFITFLVEASWARGRLLREYTLLLDPPTFMPAAASQATPAVTAPTRSAPADSSSIERPAPAPVTRAPEPEPARSTPPRVSPPPQPVEDDRPFDANPGGGYEVARNETLWGISSRVRPDSRLTMNQTMLAIFQANPQAFGGNINILRAGASLRIPSADEIYQIGRGDALNEVQRQHAAWNPGYRPVPTVPDTTPQTDLTLVPPEDEYLSDTGGDEVVDASGGDATLSREQEIEQRIFELENADVPVQQSLIEIRDNELAQLRQELAEIRGEVYEPALSDPFVDNTTEEPTGAQEPIAETGDESPDEVVEPTPEPPPAARSTRRSQPGLVDQILGVLSSWWIPIGGVLLVVGGLLFWFMRRGGDDDDEPEWRALDADDLRPGDLSATESMRAPKIEDSFMVVEQESGIRDLDETVDAAAPKFSQTVAFETPARDAAASSDDTGRFDSLEDTFSSETAVNLDQSDPIAEADFHMAYGLYDQAADLINGALNIEPNRDDLLSKLCEIYFVWGNRDAFIDAAGRLKAVVSSDSNPEWDKIVIMGQQIAADSELFAGAGVAAATRAVDMSFESEDHGATGTGALDMEFGADGDDADDIVDLGGEESAAGDDDDGLDFAFTNAESAEAEPTDFDLTAEMPAQESTVETPTIEQQFAALSGTSELPSLEDTLGGTSTSGIQASDNTAEINLDDLGLDMGGLEQTEVASFDELDATGELPSLEDQADITGRNLEVDPDATGLQAAIDPDATGMQAAIDPDATGFNEAIDIDSTFSGSGVDQSLLDATGATQVLPEDFAVATMSDIERQLGDADATMLAPGYGDEEETEVSIGDDQATLLASLDDDEDTDFDFAKTEALPPNAFTGNASLDETGELPAIATTDFDLDLDDLTAALQVSEIGDTIEQMRDDATVEQPRPGRFDDDDSSPTMALEPGEFSDDLHDARTMTEVGTKLDLARAYVDMGDPSGARSILEEVLDEGDAAQRQQAQQLLDALPS